MFQYIFASSCRLSECSAILSRVILGHRGWFDSSRVFSSSTTTEYFHPPLPPSIFILHYHRVFSSSITTSHSRFFCFSSFVVYDQADKIPQSHGLGEKLAFGNVSLSCAGDVSSGKGGPLIRPLFRSRPLNLRPFRSGSAV